MHHENEIIDYIFLGSSRVDNTINADLITDITGKSAINLGFQGAKIDDFYIVLQLLKKQNITAKFVFIQIDYIYNHQGNSEILKSSLMPFIGEDLIAKLIQERDPEYYKLKYIPFYRYLIYDYKIGFREFFNTAIGKENKIDLKNGYFPLYGNDGQNLESSLPNNIINNNRSISDINKFAKDNKIKIVYFMSPICPDTKNIDYSKKLSKKLPKFLDYSHIFPYQGNYFYNCGHLNNEGATEFSKIFAKDILRLEHESL